MKKYIFALACVALVATGCTKAADETTTTNTNTPSYIAPGESPNVTPSTVTNTSITTNTSTASTGYTASDVAKHSTSTDCWVIISGKVYNITSYIPRHPGGSARITPYCGKDATQAFATQGGEGQHSGAATNQLKSLLLGDLK